jgi:catechol 2,3-dioxygenase-like lactoylglutathione lyase family enzyme
MAIKISESCVYVSDIETSRNFFENALGFPFKQEGQFTSGIRWIKFDLGIELLVMDGAKGTGRSEKVGTVVETMTCLEVDDFKSFLSRLKLNSVTLEIVEEGYLVFRDPDGNRFEAYQK